MLKNKPEGATHLENEKPDEIEEGIVLAEDAAAQFAIAAAIPDPTDEVLLSPNRTPGMPKGGWQGVTIHTEEGWHDPSVSWLRNPASQASAHFCIRRDGRIVQLVWERDRAWHAKTSGMYHFGIEHEGGSGLGTVPILWKTTPDADRLRDDDKMLIESARLTAYLCTKHGLPVQHDFGLPVRRDTESHIAGHDQMLGNDHQDPGPKFPWKAYMNKVREFADGTVPLPQRPKTDGNVVDGSAGGAIPDTIAERVEFVLAQGRKIVGTPYGSGWKAGTWPEGPSLYSRFDKRTHTPEFVRRHAIICTGFTNFLRGQLDLPAVGRRVGDPFPGGTAAYWRVLGRNKGTQPYVRGKVFPRGWLLGAPFEGDSLALQGHVAVSLGDGRIAQSWTVNGVDYTQTAEKCHQNLMADGGSGFSYAVPPGVWLAG